MRAVAVLVVWSSVAAAQPVTLPAVPAFALPAPYADGARNVRELQVDQQRWLKRDVMVRGVVTWVYDCATAVRTPTETVAQVKKRIEQDPTVCERPKFYIGETATTPVERSLWIVDVPRPWNKLELRNLPKEELAAPRTDRCDGTKPKGCPNYKVGDTVVVYGTFALMSPHSESNSDGLVVFSAIVDETTKWSPPKLPAKPALPPAAPVAPPDPPVVVPTAKPSTTDAAKRSQSLAKLAEGAKAFGNKQFETALVAYQQAVATWAGNDAAWFGLGEVHATRGQWSDARDAFTLAVDFAPKTPRYAMWLGIARYEAAPTQLADARAALRLALQLDPSQAKAHYYLGRTSRDAAQYASAAASFSSAIASDPTFESPYIALVELYRRWSYADQAIAVAEIATQRAPTTWTWLLLGSAYDDKRLATKALGAYTQALTLEKSNQLARFARGELHFRLKDLASAKADLELFVKSAGAKYAFQKQQATSMLLDIAVRQAAR